MQVVDNGQNIKVDYFKALHTCSECNKSIKIMCLCLRDFKEITKLHKTSSFLEFLLGTMFMRLQWNSK